MRNVFFSFLLSGILVLINGAWLLYNFFNYYVNPTTEFIPTLWVSITIMFLGIVFIYMTILLFRNQKTAIHIIVLGTLFLTLIICIFFCIHFLTNTLTLYFNLFYISIAALILQYAGLILLSSTRILGAKSYGS